MAPVFGLLVKERLCRVFSGMSLGFQTIVRGIGQARRPSVGAEGPTVGVAALPRLELLLHRRAARRGAGRQSGRSVAGEAGPVWRTARRCHEFSPVAITGFRRLRPPNPERTSQPPGLLPLENAARTFLICRESLAAT